MYTRQHDAVDTYSHALGKPALVPACTRWSRSDVLVVQTTCSRRLLVATAWDQLKVTVTCSLATPLSRYVLVPFSRTSYPTVAPIFTDAAPGMMPMRMRPAYGSTACRACTRGGVATVEVGILSEQPASAVTLVS